MKCSGGTGGYKNSSFLNKMQTQAPIPDSVQSAKDAGLRYVTDEQPA